MLFRKTKHLLLLCCFEFQIALLGQLISTNSCLLMHSLLVRINVMKYNFEKQKSMVSQDVRIMETQIIGLYSIK